MSDKGLFAKSEWHRSKLSPSQVKFILKVYFRWVFSQAARHPEQDDLLWELRRIRQELHRNRQEAQGSGNYAQACGAR
jgi:hypothetical protein